MKNDNKKDLLDSMIEEERMQVMTMRGLDVVEDTDNFAISLYQKIEKEAEGLHLDTGKYRPVRRKHNKIMWKHMFRQIDCKFNSLTIYQKYFRPFIKKLYLRMKQPSCNMLKIIQLSDAEYVEKLYRIFLEREPDDEGKEHNIDRLKNGMISRNEMLYSFQTERMRTKKAIKLKYQKVSYFLYAKKWGIR